MSNLNYSSNTNLSPGSGATVYPYEAHDRSGVICLAVTGLVSLAAVLYLLLVKTPKPSTYRRTHLFGYLLSLLVANSLQSIGTIMSLKWILNNEVTEGAFCSAQGGVKQVGNVSTALWSFMISLHLFNLLFMRSALTKVVFWATIVIGWALIMILVVIGPTTIQTSDKGPYFGISGAWCWITDSYPNEQIFLEYFFEFISAGLSILLYTVILLRLRGNLARSPTGRWRLQFVPSWDSWRLAIGRDLIDTAMLRFSQNMVWFPIAYTIILVPVTIARLSSFAGHRVSFGATIFTDVVFNMTGVVNVVLLISTRRFYPNMDLPEFHTQRNKESTAALAEAGGVTPFTLTRSDTAESYRRGRETALASRVRREGSTSSKASTVSSSPRSTLDARLGGDTGTYGKPQSAADTTILQVPDSSKLTRQDSSASVASVSSRAELIPKERDGY